MYRVSTLKRQISRVCAERVVPAAVSRQIQRSSMEDRGTETESRAEGLERREKKCRNEIKGLAVRSIEGSKRFKLLERGSA